MKVINYLPLVIAVALAACGDKNASKEPIAADTGSSVGAGIAPPAAAPTAPAAPVAPVAQTALPAPSAADLAKGEKIFNATCQACHGAGVLGAPKFGDKVAWGPRIAQGIETLHANALNGVKMMPPRGGNAMLKDDEVKAAVDYMVNKAG